MWDGKPRKRSWNLKYVAVLLCKVAAGLVIMICVLLQQPCTRSYLQLVWRVTFPTLNSYDSSIMTSSLECSPSTGFPISAMRLASSSSEVSFLSGTSEQTVQEGAKDKGIKVRKMTIRTSRRTAEHRVVLHFGAHKQKIRRLLYLELSYYAQKTLFMCGVQVTSVSN